MDKQPFDKGKSMHTQRELYKHLFVVMGFELPVHSIEAIEELDLHRFGTSAVHWPRLMLLDFLLATSMGPK